MQGNEICFKQTFLGVKPEELKKAKVIVKNVLPGYRVNVLTKGKSHWIDTYSTIANQNGEAEIEIFLSRETIVRQEV